MCSGSTGAGASRQDPLPACYTMSRFGPTWRTLLHFVSSPLKTLHHPPSSIVAVPWPYSHTHTEVTEMWTKTWDRRSPCHIQSPQSEEQADHGTSLFVSYNGQAAERPASVLVTDAVAFMCVRVCSGFLFLFLFCSIFLGK